jgi:hypothetical protein
MWRELVYAVEVPAGLVRLRIVIDEKTAAVFLGEDAGESPRRVRKITDVEQVDDQQVAGLGTFDTERAAQVMYLGQIDVANVVCAVVVEDLPPGPVEALDAKFSTRLEHFHHRNVGMPAIVSFDPRIFRWSLEIELERSLWHDDLLIKTLHGACAVRSGFRRSIWRPAATRIGRTTKDVTAICENLAGKKRSAPT